MRSLWSVVAAAGAAVLLIGSVSLPAAAEPATSDEAVATSSGTKELRVEIPFDHSISLRDAVNINTAAGRPVVAYTLRSEDVAGEYSPSPEKSVDDFYEQFDEMYGTEPQASGVVVMVDQETLEASGAIPANSFAGSQQQSARKSTAGGGELEVVRTSYPEFSAGAVSPDSDAAQRADSIQDPDQLAVEREAARAASWRWEPDQADIQIVDSGSYGIWVSQFYAWTEFEASPVYMPNKWGLEFEVSAWTDNPVYSFGTRPYCSDVVTGNEFYKTQPFAKNQGWDWSVYYNAGNGMVEAPLSWGAYPDYNDLSDECNRNSLAIGIAVPTSIPMDTGGMYSVQLNILAPKGVDNSGRISGVIQTVDRHYCQDTVPWMPFTDCMNVFPGTWPGPGQNFRPTLGYDRGWTAPDKCWTSFGYGAPGHTPQAYC